jgi:hypothetical protein
MNQILARSVLCERERERDSVIQDGFPDSSISNYIS